MQDIGFVPSFSGEGLDDLAVEISRERACCGQTLTDLHEVEHASVTRATRLRAPRARVLLRHRLPRECLARRPCRLGLAGLRRRDADSARLTCLTSALIEHRKRQPRATIITNASVLAYLPPADNAVYSASEAALHFYTLSQQFNLALADRVRE